MCKNYLIYHVKGAWIRRLSLTRNTWKERLPSGGDLQTNHAHPGFIRSSTMWSHILTTFFLFTSYWIEYNFNVQKSDPSSVLNDKLQMHLQKRKKTLLYRRLVQEYSSDNHRTVYVGNPLVQIPSLLWDFKCGPAVYNKTELCFSTFVVLYRASFYYIFLYSKHKSRGVREVFCRLRMSLNVWPLFRNFSGWGQYWVSDCKSFRHVLYGLLMMMASSTIVQSKWWLVLRASQELEYETHDVMKAQFCIQYNAKPFPF